MITYNSISPLHPNFFQENEDSTSRKAIESQTNDSLSLHKFPSIIGQKDAADISNPVERKEEENAGDQKKPVQGKVFDIRVGLGLTKTEPETFRKQFQHLLPPELSARISKSHLTLLNIAEKIDNYLIFQRDMRGKASVLFSQLAKNVNENYFTDIGTMHLRQILFLDGDFYAYKIERKKASYDISIQTSFKCGVDGRRSLLRRLIFEFLSTKHEEFLKEKGLERKEEQGYWNSSFIVDILIPLIPLPWEKEAITIMERVKSNRAGIPSSQQSKQESSKLALSAGEGSFVYENPLKKKQATLKQILNKSKTTGESFRDKLYRIVAEKEAKQKQLELQKEFKLKNKSVSQNILDRVSKQTYLHIVDEINMVYISKNVNNVFFVNLIQQLIKRTQIAKDDIEEIVKDIISYRNYLTEIKTTNGVIIKVDKNIYKEFKMSIEEKII